MMRSCVIAIFLLLAGYAHAQPALRSIDTLQGYAEYAAQLKVYEDSLLYYKEKVSGNYVPAERKILLADYHRLTNIFTEKLAAFTGENAGNEWGAIALLSAVYNNTATQLLVEQLAESLTGKGLQTPYARQLQQIIQARKLMRAGKMADVIVTDENGQAVHLNDIKADQILLNFWASWCRPCRAKNALLKKQFAQYKNRGIAIISISLDENKKAWLQASAMDGIVWHNMHAAGGFNSDAAVYYNVTGLPKTFFIDRKKENSLRELHTLPAP